MLGAGERDDSRGSPIGERAVAPLAYRGKGGLAVDAVFCRPLSICGFEGRLARGPFGPVSIGQSKILRPIGSSTVAKPRSEPLTNGFHEMRRIRGHLTDGMGEPKAAASPRSEAVRDGRFTMTPSWRHLGAGVNPDGRH